MKKSLTALLGARLFVACVVHFVRKTTSAIFAIPWLRRRGRELLSPTLKDNIMELLQQQIEDTLILVDLWPFASCLRADRVTELYVHLNSSAAELKSYEKHTPFSRQLPSQTTH